MPKPSVPQYPTSEMLAIMERLRGLPLTQQLEEFLGAVKAYYEVCKIEHNKDPKAFTLEKLEALRTQIEKMEAVMVKVLARQKEHDDETG